MKWKALAWQGFTIPVPEDWEIVAFRGTSREGYLRMEDSIAPRLEIRWQTYTGPPKLEDVERVYRRLLHDKNAPEAEAVIDRRMSVPEPFAYRQFCWQGREHVHDLLVVCPLCLRAVALRLFAPSRARGFLWLRDMMKDYRDHPEGAKVRFSAYDFTCEVPREMELVRGDLRTGFLRLRFETKHAAFEFQRLRMANQLGDSPLEICRDRWRVRGKAEREAVMVNGHPGERIIGTVSRRGRAGFLKPARAAMTWLWHCPESNSLFMARAEHRGKDAPPTAGTACHGGNPILLTGKEAES